MSVLFATTSDNRPVPPNVKAGDTFFETDTSRIVLYNGENWVEYSPSDGQSIESGDIELNYVDSFDDLYLVDQPQVGDLYYIRPEKNMISLSFTAPITSNNHALTFIFSDAENLVCRVRTTTLQNENDWLADRENFGTPNWQGTANLKACFEGLNVTEPFIDIEISGENNQYISFTERSRFDQLKIISAAANLHAQVFPLIGRTVAGILVYKGLDVYGERVYSKIDSNLF